MKTVIALMLIASNCFGQSWESMGLVPGGPKKRETPAARELRLRQEKSEFIKQAMAEPKNYRTVNGRTYNTILSTNWVTLPENLYRGRFSERLSDGSVFIIERELTGRLAEHMQRFEYDRTVIVRNYPGDPANGDKMQQIRVLPVSVNSKGIRIYDYGTSAPGIINTNSPTAISPTNALNEVGGQQKALN